MSRSAEGPVVTRKARASCYGQVPLDSSWPAGIYKPCCVPSISPKELTPPIPTKDGGTLRTIQDACNYMAAFSKEREQLPHWQDVRKLILEEPHVATVSSQFQLAVLKDAKLDVSKL